MATLPASARRSVLSAAVAASLAAAACSGPSQTGSSPPPAEASATPSGTGSASSSTGAAPVPASGPPATPAAAVAPKELPRGGRTLFPAYRLVGFSGLPGAEALGKLGIGRLDDRARDIETQAKPYARGRTILPVFELIATVSHRTGGKDGMYRSRASDATVKKHLDAARRAKGILLLNIQPGRADFLPEVKAYEKWLTEPDVGLALDPEWAVDAGEVPGKTYGNTSGSELDAVARYVSGLVTAHDLPEKPIVFHQVAKSIVRNEKALRPHKGVVMIKSVDGIGSRGMKEDTWGALVKGMPPTTRPGFKLFYVEDREFGPLMTPAQVLALKPTPDYVLYE